jgi:hypothetical protein
VAARRLILVMLVLLVLSSIAAALIPVDRDRLHDQSSTQTTMQPAPTAPPRGELFRRTLPADASRPATLRIAVGDQLALTVTAKHPDMVEIPGFGELENVDPNFPATFDLLAFEPGRFPVRLVEGAGTIATIVVEPAKRSAKGSARPRPHRGSQ